jgi:hypothetical protein
MRGGPEAWLFECSKPGLRTIYASISENDTLHWPLDQWKSVTKTPLGRLSDDVKPCCGDYENCTERCLSLVDYWRERALAAEALRAPRSDT